MTNPNIKGFEPPIDERIDKMRSLSDLYGRFMKVERATFRDGHPETDGEHTLHAMFLAVAYTAKYHPEFDPSEVALLMMVHDLDEVFHGDINSLLADKQAIEQKERNEAVARARLRGLLRDDPFILTLLERYWAQEEPVTRYVRVIEKLDPSFSHLRNKGQALRVMGLKSREEFVEAEERALGRIALLGGALAPDLVAMRQELGERVAEASFGVV